MSVLRGSRRLCLVAALGLIWPGRVGIGRAGGKLGRLLWLHGGRRQLDRRRSERWNGVLLLYSHGFGPLTAADAPDPASAAALLDRGYALAGSSYDPNGSWWALQQRRPRPVPDDRRRRPPNALPHAPRHVIAVGSSMGGLISALEARAERRAHRRRALDVWDRRRRDPAQQLPARRRVRDREAARPTTPIQLVNFFTGLQRGSRHRVQALQAHRDRRRRRRRRAVPGWRSRWPS